LGLSIDFSALYPLYSIDPRAVWKGQLALLLMAGATAAVIIIPLNPDSRGLQWLKRSSIVAIMLMAAIQFALLICYLFYPSYLNHAEAVIASTSWLGWEGYPLYPPLDGGDIYGTEYGPSLFQVTGFALWLFGPSIAASKIPGLMAFALSQFLSFVTLRRAGAGVAAALTMTSVQCVVQAGFTDQGFIFGVRSDALLFLAAQTAVLTATSAPTMLTAGALGLLGGLCVNFKLHGGFYILPAFVYCLGRSPNAAAGLRLTCAAGLAAIIALAVPFSPSNASLIEYYHHFQAISNNPWNRWLFEQDVIFAGMCFAPLFLVYVLFTPKLPRAFNWFLATLVLCMMIVTIPAATTGAGPYHLLPFLPSIVWGFFVLRREVLASLTSLRARGRCEGLMVGLIIALVFGYGPIVIASWGTVLRIFGEAPLIREATAEIERTLDDYPGLKVAVGPGTGFYSAQYLRVIPVFRGNPLPIDSTSWMGLVRNGVSDQIVRRAIRECHVDLWLLPSDGPFVVISHLDGEDIYSDEVRADFLSTYERERLGRVFDQWRCKRHE